MHMETKVCTKCDKEKPLAEYWVAHKASGRLRGDCKSCSNERHKTRYQDRPEVLAEYRLTANRKHKYGVTREDVTQMLSDQGGSCAICSNKIDYTTAHLDHCHASMKVRGLLCKGCNSGLGQFRDDIELLRKAILYLKERGS